MAVEFGRIKSWLANSKTQQSNNALYQCIFNLIGIVQKLGNDAATVTSSGGGSGGSGVPGTTGIWVPMTTGAIPGEVLFIGADVMMIRKNL